MATAEGTYVDPSALIKLYVHEPESRAVSAWRRRNPGALPLTLHGVNEVVNGICLAAFWGDIDDGTMRQALASFDEDLAEGRYEPVDVLWRATLKRATDISRRHTRTIGCRTLDVIHVATALELGLRTFVTFDERQQQLARATGLRTVSPRP